MGSTGSMWLVFPSDQSGFYMASTPSQPPLCCCGISSIGTDSQQCSDTQFRWNHYQRTIIDMQPTCIRVGYGAIAQIHQQKLDTLGVRTLAVVETHPQRRLAAERAGLHVATSCADVTQLEPTFWDICVPTQYHVDILETLVACDRHANILIEKPLCRYTDIVRLEHVLRQFNGQV